MADTEQEISAVDTVRLLVSCQHRDAAGAELDESRDATLRGKLARTLAEDLKGPGRLEALSGLNALLSGEKRCAVAEVLDPISWEAFGAVLGCVEQSANSPSSRSEDGGTGSCISRHDYETVATDDDDDGNKSDGGGFIRITAAKQSLIKEVAILSESLLVQMAEIFSPKELNIMALQHIHAYSGNRTVQAILNVLRRSVQRMPPVQRAKFVESALQPALEATARVTTNKVGGKVHEPLSLLNSDDASSRNPRHPSAPRREDGPQSSSDDDEGSDGLLGGEGGGSRALGGGQHSTQGLPEGQAMTPSPEAFQNAASVAEEAISFIGPLLEQAYTERMQARDAAEALDGAGRLRAEDDCALRDVNKMAFERASDISTAAYLGFALSALELVAETSVCVSAAAAAANTVSVVSTAESDTTGLSDTDAALPSTAGPVEVTPAARLAKAEERLVEVVLSGSTADLQFILAHSNRLSYSKRLEQRKCGDDRDCERGEEVKETQRVSSIRSVGLTRLGDFAVSGPLPWTLQGVSCLAYLVACEPKLRLKWLPMVYSRRAERNLLLPHAEVLMRAKSKTVASKGLELACFVAERSEPFPDDAGAFAFEWESEDENEDDEKENDRMTSDGGWESGVRHDNENGIEGGASKGEHRRSSRRRRRRRIFDPYYVDIVCFLQILVDVTVSCPVASMRARGHEAMSGFLAAVGEASRFRVLKRLIDRCPWPNATGLLLDMFRKEIDRAMRRCPCRYGDERSLPTTEGQTSGNDDECSKSTKNSASIVKDKEHSITEGRRAELQGSSFAHPTGNTTADADGNACAGERETGRVKSPFASAAAGGVVCEQLQKACRGGPPASLLMDMDSRTGALTLAWYAHALNRAESVGGNGLGDGRLKLHELEKLRKNRLLVEGFLQMLRGTAISASSAGPDHFRLFILEDAAQQCLEELLR